MNIYIYLGTLQSYNFAGGQHLANQDYSMCIREAIKIERKNRMEISYPEPSIIFYLFYFDDSPQRGGGLLQHRVLGGHLQNQSGNI